MEIVILDGYTTNPGDLSWDPLRALGNVTVYDRTLPEEIPQRAATADIIVCNKTVWNKAAFAAAPNLKMITLLAMGYNMVDLEEANRRGIVVANVPAYSTPAVAQHTFALILELANHVGAHAESVAKGGWEASKDFSYSVAPLVELAGKTLGIVGMGNIGQAVARIGAAFDMNVVFYNRSPKPELAAAGFKQVELDELLATSDFISLHCPATPETERIINAQAVEKMKPGAFIVNTSRGTLVDEEAVAAALTQGKLAGFGADVVSMEPMCPENPLNNAPRTFITPHIAWATKEARTRLIDAIAANISAYQSGNPINVVNNPQNKLRYQ